ncbi:MAG: hypothetical protein R3F55_18435 [Alphaproteobacteria bacterium]
MSHAHSRRALAAGRTSAIAATAAALGLGLAACVPVAGAPQGPGPTPGPGFGATQSNGVWTVPPFDHAGALWNTSEGALRLKNVQQAPDLPTLFVYGIYEDGTRLVWGTLDIATGRWQGSWVRAGGPVACPIALPPPPQLVGEGFQFQQPLYVWGTFDVIWTEPEVAFQGSWGSCGVPLGVPWTGRAAGF